MLTGPFDNRENVKIFIESLNCVVHSPNYKLFVTTTYNLLKSAGKIKGCKKGQSWILNTRPRQILIHHSKPLFIGALLYKTGFLALSIKDFQNMVLPAAAPDLKTTQVCLTSPVPFIHPHNHATVFVICDNLQHSMTVLQDKSEIFCCKLQSFCKIFLSFLWPLATHCRPATLQYFAR